MIDFVYEPLSKTDVVVFVRGNLTEITRGYFFNCVGDLIENGYRNVIIDFSELNTISSSGLASLLRARKQVQATGGNIMLAGINSVIATVLERTKLGSLLAIFPNVAKARESFAATTAN